MSGIVASGLDRNALPAALLPIAKSHLRVDGSYDDAYITDAIKRAISWFERFTNVSVNKVTWTWSPAIEDFCNRQARLPISPVNSFTVAVGTTDVSASYALESMSMNGVGLYRVLGDFQAGMAVAVVSGYADETVLDPGITDAVLRYTAHLYENREILVINTEIQTPGWMTDVISTYWFPRA